MKCRSTSIAANSRFLTSMPKLVRGGALAFVIPQRILRLTEIARYLASRYDRFEQVLLLATRREKYNVPANEEIEAIQRLAESNLPPLGFAPEPIYPMQPVPLKGASSRAITFHCLD